LVEKIRSGEAGKTLKNAPLHPGAFDLVKLPVRWKIGESITRFQIQKLSARQLSQVRLVEVKSTNRRLGKTLKGHFFSLQYPEQLAAQALGTKYEIVFVVMAPGQAIFKVVRNWNDIWAKARKVHLSFSIQF